MSDRRRPVPAPGLFPGLILLAAACGEGQEEVSKDLQSTSKQTSDGSPPDRIPADLDLPLVEEGQIASSVILITLDTVRADHLSLYGYDRPTSPQLEKLASRATVYTRAKAAAPWTLPAHASIFTGLYPFEHGARTVDIDEVPGELRHNNATPLARQFVTLAEVFARNRWQTAAFTANVAYLDRKFDLDQGFDVYEPERGTVESVNERFLRWLRHRREGPFFAFLNYMDAHRPYNAAPREGFPEYEDRSSGELMRELYPLVMQRQQAPADKLQKLSDLYDTAIANLDDGLGQLFRRLDRQGILEDALIVVVGDHGEFLGEHHLIEHSKDVYEGTLHVPLIVKAPRQQEGRRDDELISQVHLPALILAHCALEEIPEGAVAFTRHWPRGSLLGENYYSRLHDLRETWGARFDRIRSVVYEDGWKYIHSSDGAHELYDLGEDPREERNVLSEQPSAAWATRLAALMPEERRLLPGRIPQEYSEAELANLRALGYLPEEDDEPDPIEEGGSTKDADG